MEKAPLALTAIIDNARRSRPRLTGTMANRAVALGRRLGLPEEEISVPLTSRASTTRAWRTSRPRCSTSPGVSMPTRGPRSPSIRPAPSEIVKPIEFRWSRWPKSSWRTTSALDGRGYPRGLAGRSDSAGRANHLGGRCLRIHDEWAPVPPGHEPRRGCPGASPLRRQSVRREGGRRLHATIWRAEDYGHDSGSRSRLTGRYWI